MNLYVVKIKTGIQFVEAGIPYELTRVIETDKSEEEIHAYFKELCWFVESITPIERIMRI